MTGTADSNPPVSMADVHARLARIMALIQQMGTEAEDHSSSITAQRSGETTGGSVE